MNGEQKPFLNDEKPFWHFRRMQPGEENQNPIQGEFFTPDTLGELCDVLVRESIQNSLDAEIKEEPGPVTVKIHIGKFDRETQGRQSVHERYFNGLWEHLQAKESGIREVPDAKGLLQYICFEDFKTRGLVGDPGFDDSEAPLDERERNDFFFFWRNIARSAKDVKDLGSWGVGKQVFAASSCINTYFGFSVSAEDRCPSLMGKGILKIHHCPHKCAPYGYWAVFDETRGDFAMPVQNNGFLDTFAKDFNLQRNGRSGLSVVVPFCRVELMDTNPLCAAVIRHYFYPILTGRLVVEVGKDYRPNASNYDHWTVIDKGSIEAIASRVLGNDSPEFVSLLELASWAQSLAPEEHLLPLKTPNFSNAPDWNDQRFDDEVVSEAWRRFEADGRIALRVPVRVMKAHDNLARCCWMKVYYGRAPSDISAQVKYIRQGIDIVSASNAKLGKGVVGMVEIDDPGLSELLRAAEPPAHDKWETRAGRLDDYEKGAKSVRFVIHAPHKLWSTLSSVENKRDPDLLRDIFFIDLADLAGPKGTKKQGPKKRKDAEPEDVDISEPPTRRYSPVLTPTSIADLSGFQLSAPRDATHTPSVITVRCAYETATGNPFKNYSPLDFKFAAPPIHIETEGVQVRERGENALVVDVLSPDYRIAISGFDTNRDLRTSVRVDMEEGDDDLDVEEVEE